MKRDNSLLRRLKYTPTAVVASVSLLAGCGSPPTNNHELAREYQTPAQTQYVSSVLSPQTSPTPQPRPNTTQICGIPYYQIHRIVPDDEIYSIVVGDDIDIRNASKYLTLNHPSSRRNLSQLLARKTNEGIYFGLVRGFPVNESQGIVSMYFIPNEDNPTIQSSIFRQNISRSRVPSQSYRSRANLNLDRLNRSSSTQNDELCRIILDIKTHRELENLSDIIISLRAFFSSMRT